MRRLASGFTLVELMITIAVLAVMAAIAFPSFQGTLRSNRVATATNEVVAALALARSEALKNGRGAGVCASTNGTACDGSWNQGWMVWADANGNGGFDNGETVIRYAQAHGQMDITGSNAAAIAFDSRGRRIANADQVLTLRPDECGGQPLQRKLTIKATGQTSIEKEACS